MKQYGNVFIEDNSNPKDLQLGEMQGPRISTFGDVICPECDKIVIRESLVSPGILECSLCGSQFLVNDYHSEEINSRVSGWLDFDFRRASGKIEK